MTRGIQKRNLSASRRHHIGTDMLSDASGFFVRHIGMADSIQKRRLSVVYMTHHADDGRSGDKRLLRIFLILQHLADHILFHFRFRIKIVLQRDLARRFKIQLGVHRQHFSCHKKLLNNNGRLNLHALCQIGDADALRQRQFLRLQVLFLHSRRFRLRSDKPARPAFQTADIRILILLLLFLMIAVVVSSVLRFGLHRSLKRFVHLTAEGIPSALASPAVRTSALGTVLTPAAVVTALASGRFPCGRSPRL